MSPNTSPGVDPAGVAPALVHSDSKAGHGGPANARVPGDPGRKHTQEQLRVIVAGESGLGKTTFLNNIFRHLNRGENPMDQAAVVQARGGGGMFGHGKTLTIEERSFKYKTHEEDEYEFFLVDTPGYGDHVNTSKSFRPVVDYVAKGNKAYLAEIMSGNDSPEKDGRTDVCIYFIAAHRFKAIDIEYMEQLSKVVAVIPVIGKSDSMTLDEMKSFKKEIIDLAAKAATLDFFQFSDHAWTKCVATLQIANPPHWLGEKQPPPYAVISSRLDDPGGHISAPDPARRYPWGTCHVMRPAHSDNAYLQCLLLEDGFQDMKKEMKERHRAFVQNQMKPLKEKYSDALKGLPRAASVAAIDALDLADCRGKRSVFMAMAVVFSLLAVVLALAQGWVRLVDPNRITPPAGIGSWSEVIIKIQELEGWDRILEAADSGEEHLDVLLDVLMEYYKNT
ncbi:unnamed protein product, partial [Scytosiphon promiscuus]